MQVVLRPEAGPKVIVAEGAVYGREFLREAQPFEVSEEEWQILARTGLFESVESA